MTPSIPPLVDLERLLKTKAHFLRKPLVSSKYYFFDIGVVGSLQGREFRIGTTEFGNAFETLLMHELM